MPIFRSHIEHLLGIGRSNECYRMAQDPLERPLKDPSSTLPEALLDPATWVPDRRPARLVSMLLEGGCGYEGIRLLAVLAVQRWL